MKVLSFFLFISLLFNDALFAQNHVKGNQNVIKTTRNVGNFSEIEVAGSINVFLTQGSSNKLVIEADENLHDLIKTTVSGNKLTVKNKEQVRDAKKFNVYITFKDIKAVEGHGATDISALTAIKTSGEFYIQSSGAVDMILAKGLSCQSLKLSGSGSSDIEVSDLSTGDISANVTGSVDLEMTGKADQLTLSSTGSSDVSAKNLIVSTANISATGSSDIYVHTTNSIMVNASGSSDVYYWGNPPSEHIKSSASADVMIKQ